ncbi:DNA adenine methylase [Anatilimnocola sp. NA78]|uniref:DNA adenine methylase n=1 Tax=Anatilimnocola sp. NA78 TaxID=3415683 RepID=UPI003CE536A2
MSTGAKINAIAPWFGGKRTMAPLIVTELGKHTQYFEPFCGSMAVLFAKEPSQKETVNDLHGDLINLARCLQTESTAEELYDRCNRALVCEGLLDDARAYFAENPLPGSEPDVTRAYWYFLASWTARNGTAGTKRIDYQLAVRWTKSGGSPTVRWKNVVESMPWFHQRLRNVVILKRDAFQIIDRFEDVKQTAMYIDAPYTADTRSGFRKGKGSDHKYLHEFEHGTGLFEDDHKRLRDVLAAYRHARIVVSYYDCPRIRELYNGWTFVTHHRQKHLHAQNGRGMRLKEAPEVLLINGPSYA